MEEFPLEWSKDGDLSADRPSKGGTLTLEDGRVNCRALHTIRLWVEALPTGLLWHEYRREQYNSENGRKAFETPQPGYQRASHSHRVFKFPIKALRELSLALALLV
jgi:hypothetical protein